MKGQGAQSADFRQALWSELERVNQAFVSAERRYLADLTVHLSGERESSGYFGEVGLTPYRPLHTASPHCHLPVLPSSSSPGRAAPPRLRAELRCRAESGQEARQGATPPPSPPTPQPPSPSAVASRCHSTTAADPAYPQSPPVAGVRHAAPSGAARAPLLPPLCPFPRPLLPVRGVLALRLGGAQLRLRRARPRARRLDPARLRRDAAPQARFRHGAGD